MSCCALRTRSPSNSVMTSFSFSPALARRTVFRHGGDDHAGRRLRLLLVEVRDADADADAVPARRPREACAVPRRHRGARRRRSSAWTRLSVRTSGPGRRRWGRRPRAAPRSRRRAWRRVLRTCAWCVCLLSGGTRRCRRGRTAPGGVDREPRAPQDRVRPPFQSIRRRGSWCGLSARSPCRPCTFHATLRTGTARRRPRRLDQCTPARNCRSRSAGRPCRPVKSREHP